MSRAAWAGILLLGAGLGLAAYFLTRGLPDEALEAVRAAELAIESSEGTLTETRGAFEDVIGKDRDFLEGQPDIRAAKQGFEQRQATLAEAKAIVAQQIEPLVDADDYDSGPRVIALSREAAEKAATAVSGATAGAGVARQLLRYKTDHADLMRTARERVAAAQQVQGDAAVEQQIALASTSYPEAKPKLAQRKADLASHAAQVQRSAAELERLAAASPVDYVATGKVADAIIEGYDKLTAMQAKLKTDIAELGQSIDKILIDMKQENGRSYHKYRIITNGVERETGWEEVTQSVYQQHRDHLGMAIYSKPEGKFADEAETVAAPPGYAYVGNERYGRWETRNGQDFWVFYGKYALMRDLLWGAGRYTPVYRDNYRSYRTTVRGGKPYYGANKEYGTQGTKTRTRYAGSNYYKQQRRTSYSGSRYSGSGSGGRYSGSNYSGRGGSRSGGSRGSRYRSSSFGGGGK